MKRPDARVTAWLGALVVAVAFPLVIATPYYVSTAIIALQFVGLAVAFDLVVGRIGALSLAQPVFYGYGAYVAALVAKGMIPVGGEGWSEFVLAVIGGVVLALLIGIPSFRLSLHSFAMGTLGFALIGQLIAGNWMDVTRGPLCLSAIPPLTIQYVVGSFRMSSLQDAYYIMLGLAALAIGVVASISRSRLGLAFTAVRDDPILAAARGLSPNRLRLVAFSISAAISAAVGVFAAHFQTVVCPTEMDISITVLLLIIVFIGGRGSLRGVVSAAVIFTVLPELLRLTESLRLVIFGALLLVTVTAFPDGVENIYRMATRAWRRRSTPRVSES
jgi:ABC-type branched-subunit amino acid transport system permease subunit